MTSATRIEQPPTEGIDTPVRALGIISAELNETIRNAHLALEDCVDGTGGTAALTRAGDFLHQARGALQVTEMYGAALLVEEMELACRYLASLRAGAGREDGLDALTRSMVQLPIYIERLLGGGRDIALVLLPLLNDLRAARGEPLLSEGTLLLLNLSPERSGRKVEDRAGSGDDPVQVARRLRPKYQLALLGWIKGGDAARHLETLGKVAAALENAATRNDMYQLWWVVGGVLESLRDGGLETSVALKRLLGQTDRHMKFVIDEGDSAFDAHPIDDLLNNLLYYVARSATAGPRISEIRAAFNLSELLPGDEQVEQARDALSAPSIRLMKTVAAAIKEDLASVKDVLDIFVRTGMNKSSELLPQLDLLKKISDTLGVLGLGELRTDIDGEIERLRKLVDRGGVANEGLVLDIASTLLRVEDRLDQQLLRLTAPQDSPRGETGTELPPAEAEDYRKVAESVMRECIINLARIKETVSAAMGTDGPVSGLDAIPSLVRGIRAGLMMLNKPRATEVVERIGAFISLMLKSGGPSALDQKETDRLADAIVSIEYYMETVKAGRTEPWYMLDNAEACLGVLRSAEERLRQRKDEAAAAGTMKIPVSDLEQAAGSAQGEAREDAAPVPEAPAPVVATDAEHLDPELLELFIEEAKEEIASINRHLPEWAARPDDMESLITIRRSFHTLKGSGRMVGAERIGDYCWSVENLLNRIINRTLVRTPPMVDFIVEAAGVVPQLIEQLEAGTEPSADILTLSARAQAFAEGNPDAAALKIDSGKSPQEEEPALEMDPVLLDIFSKETAGHVKVITDYLAACEDRSSPYAVTDKLYRACHTLHGSANMANVDRGVAVAGALNRFVRRVYDYKVGFDRSGLDALRAASRAIAAIVGEINQVDRERADYTALIEHLDRLGQAIKSPEESSGRVANADAPRPASAAAGQAEQAGYVTADAPAAGPAVADYDEEIAAIFTEESAELLEDVDAAFDEWAAGNTATSMDELKRHLHTLKGGARMAGITAMGNLSHEIETLLISVDDGRVEAGPAVAELLQRSIDELHRMRDLVMAGKPVAAANELELRIRQANAGADFSVPEQAERPARPAELEPSEPGAFTVEPEESVSMVIVEAPLDNDEVPAGGDSRPAEPTPGESLQAAAAAEDALPDAAPGAPPEEAGALPEIDADADAWSGPETGAESARSGPAVEPAESPAGGAEPAAPPAPVAEPDETRSPQPGPQEVPGPAFRPDVLPVTGEPPEAEPETPAAPITEVAARKAPAELRSLRGGEPRQEFARIDAELLEDLLNAAGEISIYHSRLSQQVSAFEFHVEELAQTATRLRDQLRKLEIETEAQIMHKHQDTLVAQDFDPLELDRYSTIQQLSRALAESANDLGSLRELMSSVTNEAEGLLLQQSRVTAELQDGLMRTRMVPFERHVGRLTRLVRQAAQEAGKRAELAVEGASGELDRQVLEKMLPPLEHMLRNAVVHGLEDAGERQASGKSPVGRITIRLHREGSEMVIDVADDGRGLDVDAIRRKAQEQGLLSPEKQSSDDEIMELILTPGFSTATSVTQSAGRGVGMDVVANEVKKLGGSLRISSVTGQGTNFTVRLPFTLAITQALIVRTGEEVYALPLPSVEGVARIPRAELEELLQQPEPSYDYGEQTYKFRHLGMYLDGQAANLPEDDSFVPVILVRAGEYSAALLTDEMLASREIVVKSVGPQLAGIRGISGATILGDGSIVLILDINALVRSGAPVVEIKKAAPAPSDERPVALVVDDSITVRRVTERFLQRNGLRVLTAKDGLDAISVMQDEKPDIILLDIEMPRMDGYEFASHVRNDDRVADVPIIMITSRVGDKHRARAIELGVNDYLGKPYQDAQLLDAIRRQLEEKGIELQ
jgi:chemosensory pili system protein ChpA (sensor histidine kinase/response regulator)